MSMGNPISDLLENRTFPRIAQALRDRQERILRAWEQGAHKLLPRYAEELSQTQLRNQFPLILQQMATALAAVTRSATAQLERQSASHAVERFAQNYEMRGLLLELRLLRRIAFEEIHLSFDGMMTEEEIIALDQAMDVVVEEAVLAFGEQQYARFRAAADAQAKYLSFMSHDLRNNLNGIMLRLEELRQRLQPVPEFAQDARELAAIERSIRRRWTV